MATLAVIRAALADMLGDALSELSLYPEIPENPNLPAAVVIPDETDFVTTMGRGNDTHDLFIYVLCPLADWRLGQNQLDDYVAGSGPKSIRELVWNNRSLGIEDDNGLPDADAHVHKMSNYGGHFEAAGIDHMGAILHCRVHSPGYR